MQCEYSRTVRNLENLIDLVHVKRALNVNPGINELTECFQCGVRLDVLIELRPYSDIPKKKKKLENGMLIFQFVRERALSLDKVLFHMHFLQLHRCVSVALSPSLCRYLLEYTRRQNENTRQGCNLASAVFMTLPAVGLFPYVRHEGEYCVGKSTQIKAKVHDVVELQSYIPNKKKNTCPFFVSLIVWPIIADEKKNDHLEHINSLLLLF